MAESIRVGIIGANFGARQARAFATLENIEVAAVAEPDTALRDALASELDITARYDSADDLFQAGGLDAVVISSPTYLHERHVGQAFDGGLHVLCDSPVGANGREVSHIVTSAGLVGKIFMWSNPLRFDPRMAEARALIEAGSLGEVFHASGRVEIPVWEHAADSWRLDRERGGGALLEAGTQALDALWFVMGAPDPMEAMAARFDLFSKRHSADFDATAEDALAGMTRFKNGACLQFSAQIDVGKTRPAETSLAIWGERGSIDLIAGALHLKDGSAPNRYAEARDEQACLVAQAEAFARAITTKEEPISHGKDALALSKILDALAASAHEKQAVSIRVERTLDDLFGGL